MITVKSKIEKGSIRLPKKVGLPDGTRVIVNSNWSGNTGGFSIVSNQLDVGVSEDIYWNTTSFGSNQEVFVKLASIDPNAPEIGLVLKSQSNGGFSPGFIEVLYNPVSKFVEVWTYANTQGRVKIGASLPVTFVNGDQFGALALNDGRVMAFRNGVLVGTRDVTTWPYYSNGGYLGLFNINASNTILDEFGGGNTGAGPTPTPTATPTNTPLPTDTPTPFPTDTLNACKRKICS